MASQCPYCNTTYYAFPSLHRIHNYTSKESPNPLMSLHSNTQNMFWLYSRHPYLASSTWKTCLAAMTPLLGWCQVPEVPLGSAGWKVEEIFELFLVQSLCVSGENHFKGKTQVPRNWTFFDPSRPIGKWPLGSVARGYSLLIRLWHGIQTTKYPPRQEYKVVELVVGKDFLQYSPAGTFQGWT
jgi:hypothetical protein